MVTQNVFEVQHGTMTCWELGKATNPDILCSELDQLGLDKYSPERRTHLAALKVAMSEHFSKAEELIRPLDKKKENGYSVVVETKGTRENSYRTTVRAHVDEDTGLVTCSDESHLDSLRELQRHYRRTLSSSAVSTMLVDILRNELSGIAMTNTGKPYFVPEDQVNRWQEIANVVERAGDSKSPNEIIVTPFAMNSTTLRAMLRRVQEEVMREVEALKKEVAKGDLGTQALLSRAQHAAAVRARVQLYEAILGQPLSTCRDALDTIFVAQTAAESVQEANDVFAELFS